MHNYSWRSNSETFAWRIRANKTRSNYLVLAKPFLGACTKDVTHHVSPDGEKRPHLVIAHTGTNDLKFVNLTENIVNETISLALSINEKSYQIAVSWIVHRGDRFSKKAKDVQGRI